MQPLFRTDRCPASAPRRGHSCQKELSDPFADITNGFDGVDRYVETQLRECLSKRDRFVIVRVRRDERLELIRSEAYTRCCSPVRKDYW